MMFSVGDSVVYPLYGAGIIEKVEEREILGETRSYYIMKLPLSGMSVMIPTKENTAIGLRSVVDKATAVGVIESFPSMSLPDLPNWNKRYRENMLLLKKGDIGDVAAVVKSLMDRDAQRGLSTGERRMLITAKQVLVSEIALSMSKKPETVERLIDEAHISAGEIDI